MKTVDLSLPLELGMPVYPGDPAFHIEEIQTLAKEGWSMRQVQMTTHLGTHVNVPSHMVTGGVTLDAFPPDAFFGPARIYHEGMQLTKKEGVIFRDQNIDRRIADLLIATPPKFIGLSAAFEFDVSLERLTLIEGLLSFENLTNLDTLPDAFMFYGFPLPLRGGDGSPVRAVAIVS